MSDYIPQHLLAEVLLRLPFDSLLRSRCVSKSWRAFIDSPEFTKLHLHRSHLQTNSSHHHHDTNIISLIREEEIGVSSWGNSWTFYSFHAKVLCDSGTAIAKQINCNITDPLLKDDVGLVGSCNGLLCLVNTHTWHIFLWNPWIQLCREIRPPRYGNSTGRKIRFRLGFGYDQTSDDYKVLALIIKGSGNGNTFHQPSSQGSDAHHEAHVYSSKLNSWKRILGIPFAREPEYSPENGVFANGALHWVGGISCIIAFDLSSDEFRIMPCPSREEDHFIPYLSTLNACLCLLSYYRMAFHRCADILVMENYGVDESCWTELTSIQIPFDEWTPWVSIKPLACSEDKNLVVLQISNTTLVLYDLDKKSFSYLPMSGAATGIDSRLRVGALRLDSCVCVGSLVMP